VIAARRRAFTWGLRIVGTGYVIFLIGIPVFGIIWKAFAPGPGKFWAAISNSWAVHALLVTLGTGVVALALNTVFGVAIALALARKRFPGKGILEALIDLPLALSPVIIGLAIVLTYSSTEGWFGPFLTNHGIMILFAYPGIVMCAAFVSLPYVVREVLPVLQEIGIEPEQAAETLGARPWTVFWKITLPSIRWGLTYGMLLTSARILGEFGAVSVVSGDIIGHTQTYTQYVDYDFENFNTAGAYAGAVVLGVIAFVLLIALTLSRRTREADAL
jgi:sulfate/thiosulfate transport system permease protein